MIRLGFHYHIPAVRRGGSLFTYGVQGRFLDALAQKVTRLRCFLHTPTRSEQSACDHRLEAQNIDLVSMGEHTSVPRRLLASRRLARILVDESVHIDALLIRGPTPLLPALGNAPAGVPLVLLLVGDLMEGLADSGQPWWRRHAIHLLWRRNSKLQFEVANRALTFVNSAQLYNRYKPHLSNLLLTKTTTLSRRDFVVRHDTCTSRPIRLLYTGRLARNKGLMQMVQALDRLVGQGEDVVLELIGWPESGDNLLGELRTYASDRGLAHRLSILDPLPAGPILYKRYLAADIFVIASTSSFEGFPRSIWEAMAHSLPVVATRVGSIPSFCNGAAALVQPRNIDELATALRAIIHDTSYRQSLIASGLLAAADATFESQIPDFVGHIEAWTKLSRSQPTTR